MKTVYFVRRGQSQGNAEDKVAGSEINSLLTELGRQQAVEVAKSLQGQAIDLVVTSPLGRAKETARIIATELSYSGEIVENKDFRERSVGPLAGKTFEEYKKAVRTQHLPDGVETIQEMVQRVENGLAWLKHQGSNNILLVSHDGIGKIVKMVSQGVTDLDYETVHKIKKLSNSESYKFYL